MQRMIILFNFVHALGISLLEMRYLRPFELDYFHRILLSIKQNKYILSDLCWFHLIYRLWIPLYDNSPTVRTTLQKLSSFVLKKLNLFFQVKLFFVKACPHLLCCQVSLHVVNTIMAGFQIVHFCANHNIYNLCARQKI
jgi:hypothetical protein